MDIDFENELITTNEKTLSSNIFLLFSDKSSSHEKLVSAISVFYLSSKLKFSVNINKYKSKIRNIISNNQRRFCYKINDMAIFGNLNSCHVIILSYTNINNKNYINGFATLRVNMDLKFVSIDFLCGDLFFSGVGSNLLTFIKLFTIHMLHENACIILNSIASHITQNFYISNFFYKNVNEKREGLHNIIGTIPYFKNEKYNYIWKFNIDNLEEQYVFENFDLPFQIKKTPQSKYLTENEPELIDELNIFKPLYTNKTSRLVIEKGGKKTKLKKYGVNKRKVKSKTYKKHKRV